MQVLESGAFMSLGTVVSVISSTTYGTPVLRARLTYEDGTDAHAEVKFGGLEILPLGIGQTARLTLQPLQRSDIGNGPGRNAALHVITSYSIHYTKLYDEAISFAVSRTDSCSGRGCQLSNVVACWLPVPVLFPRFPGGVSGCAFPAVRRGAPWSAWWR